jgi:hypothetical protein
VKKEFQETFAHENKSAVITRLMKQAVEVRKTPADPGGGN